MSHAYVGTKIVRAEEMTEAQFHAHTNRVFEKNDDRDGYLVRYADGYESWSPKDTFEQNYRRLTVEEKRIADPRV